MKRIFKYATMGVISFLLAYFMFNFMSYAGIEFYEDNMDYSISVKGIKNAVAFDVNKAGEFIIAKKDKIICSKKDGKIQILYTTDTDNIITMSVKDKIIYIVKGNSLYSINIDTRQVKQIINNIPIRGQENECKLLNVGDKILLSIGAVTNSGVVEDKQMAFGKEVYDRSPMDVYSSGRTYGKDNTGVFSPVGKNIALGEKIKSSLPANACILSIDKTNKVKIFASGIKNIVGFDVSSDGKVFAVVSGMEEKGLRPIANDKDYIYEIDEDDWLGWPDFSGGDPVTSPRFRVKDEKVNFVLENHMTENPKAPLYQYKGVNDISCMAILSDNNKKDSIIFYDKKENNLNIFKNNTLPTKMLQLNKKCKIVDLKNKNSNIYMLDGERGVIYNVFPKEIKTIEPSKIILLYFFIGIILTGLILIEYTKISKKLSK